MEPYVFSEEVTETKNPKPLSLFNLCRNPTHAINLGMMIICWTSTSFNYYLINFYVKYMNGSIYAVNIIQSSAEIVGYFLGAYLTKKLSSKRVLTIAFAFVAICGLL